MSFKSITRENMSLIALHNQLTTSEEIHYSRASNTEISLFTMTLVPLGAVQRRAGGD